MDLEKKIIFLNQIEIINLLINLVVPSRGRLAAFRRMIVNVLSAG